MSTISTYRDVTFIVPTQKVRQFCKNKLKITFNQVVKNFTLSPKNKKTFKSLQINRPVFLAQIFIPRYYSL